ncbi:MAG: hypothetical protein ACE5FW_02340 [Candidatus Aenigmatarchaeota archaeon]
MDKKGRYTITVYEDRGNTYARMYPTDHQLIARQPIIYYQNTTDSPDEAIEELMTMKKIFDLL